MHKTSVDYEDQYQAIMLEVLTLKRQLRAQRVKSALASLAAKPTKSINLQSLERKLHEELHSHNRGGRIDLLLELLETHM